MDKILCDYCGAMTGGHISQEGFLYRRADGAIVPKPSDVLASYGHRKAYLCNVCGPAKAALHAKEGPHA